MNRVNVVAALLILTVINIDPSTFFGDSLPGKRALAGEIDRAARETRLDGAVGIQFHQEYLEVHG